LQGYFALTNHIEFVRFFAFMEEELARVEAHVGCTADDELDVLWFNALEKWMFCDDALEFFNHVASLSKLYVYYLIHFPE